LIADKIANADKKRASTVSLTNDRVVAVIAASCEVVAPQPKALVSSDSEHVIRKIPVADIKAPMGRSIDRRTVAIIAESFREAGQTAAILVVREDNGGYQVISGYHRVAAAIELGWDKIDAAVLECDERGKRFIKIAENRHRRDLSVLERAELDHEWIELVRNEAMQVARPAGGRQPMDLGLSKAARALGVTKEKIMRSYRIASVSPEAKIKARELGFDDNQAVLLQVAKLTSQDAQIALLSEISERKIEPRKEPSATGTLAPEGFQEGATQLREDTPSTSPVPYPDLPRGLERRPIDAQVEMLADEWRNSRLRKLLVCAPLEARDRFVWDVLLSEFPDAVVKALPRTIEGSWS